MRIFAVWPDILTIGVLLLLLTCMSYRGAVIVLKRYGMSIWEQNKRKGFLKTFVEFSISVVLSFLASAALGFLYVGLLGFFGFPIGIL
jgi:hypothetical protein